MENSCFWPIPTDTLYAGGCSVEWVRLPSSIELLCFGRENCANKYSCSIFNVKKQDVILPCIILILVLLLRIKLRCVWATLIHLNILVQIKLYWMQDGALKTPQGVPLSSNVLCRSISIFLPGPPPPQWKIWSGCPSKRLFTFLFEARQGRKTSAGLTD